MNKNIIRILLVTIVLGIIGTYYFINNGKDDEYLAYIPNVGDGTISTINTKNQKVENTIKIGEEVSHGISATNDGKKIYTGDLDEGKVFVYDTESKKITKTINTGKRIHGIDITPNSKYVLLASGALEVDDEYNYIQIIDTKTDEVVKTIKSDAKSPAHIDFTKDSKIAYVANVMSNDVSIVDIEKGEIIDTVKVGIMPNESEPSPDGKFLYVANVQEGSLSVVDTKTKKEIDKIKVSAGTHGIAVTNDSKYIWTTNRFDKDIAVIDASTKKIIKKIGIEGEPNHISISPDNKYVYVTDLETGKLNIIDVKSFEIIKKVKLGNEPHEIDFIKL